MTEAPSAPVRNDADNRGLKRTRRVLITVLVVMIVLLLLAFVVLLRIFQPPGEIANKTEAGGIEWVRSIYGWGNTADKQLQAVEGVAFGPDGTVWATVQGVQRVVGFNPDGSFKYMLFQGPRLSTPTALSFPTAVAVDEQGLVYVADQTASKVVVMNSSNQIVRSIYVPRPSAVAVRGDRLVVGSGPGFVIMKKDGTVVKLVGTQGSGPDQFDGVKGLAISADGTIYVIDQYNNRVSAYDTNGNRLWIRSTGKAGNNTNVHTTNQSQVATTGADMQLPAGATIDGAGRLVVIDPFGFNLVVLNPKNGDLIAKYGEAGTAEGQFIYPSSVSYDPQRDWFAVADTANSRVQIVRIPGSGGSATSAIQRTLLGPIRACLIPLLLLIIVIVVSLIVRGFRRRRDAKAASETALPDTEPPAAEDV